MSIKISLKKNINDKLIKNYVLFANEKYKINSLSKISLSKMQQRSMRTLAPILTIKKNSYYLILGQIRKL